MFQVNLRSQISLLRTELFSSRLSYSRPGGNPHIAKNEGPEDPAELEKYQVKFCSTCEEDGVEEIATGYCQVRQQ